MQVKRINVSAAFFLAIEYQETGFLVYRFYKAAYGNIPGAPVPVRFEEFLPDTRQIGQDVEVGKGDWQAKLEANKQAFAAAFVLRARFTNAVCDLAESGTVCRCALCKRRSGVASVERADGGD